MGDRATSINIDRVVYFSVCMYEATRIVPFHCDIVRPNVTTVYDSWVLCASFSHGSGASKRHIISAAPLSAKRHSRQAPRVKIAGEDGFDVTLDKQLWEESVNSLPR